MEGLSTNLKQVAVAFLVIAFLVQIMGTIGGAMTPLSLQANIVTDLLTGFSSIGDYASLFVVVIIAVYVMRYLDIL